MQIARLFMFVFLVVHRVRVHFVVKDVARATKTPRQLQSRGHCAQELHDREPNRRHRARQGRSGPHLSPSNEHDEGRQLALKTILRCNGRASNVALFFDCALRQWKNNQQGPLSASRQRGNF